MGTKERVQRLWAQQTITARDVYDAFPLSCPVVFGAPEPPLIHDQLVADIEAERAAHPLMTVAYDRMLDAAYGPFMAQARLNAAWLERAAKQVLG